MTKATNHIKQNKNMSAWIWLSVSVAALVAWALYVIYSDYPKTLAEWISSDNVTQAYPLASAITYLPLILGSYFLGQTLMLAVTGKLKDIFHVMIGLLVGTILACALVWFVYSSTFSL